MSFREKLPHVSGKETTLFVLSLLLASAIWLIHNLSQTYSDIMAVTVSAQSNIDGHSEWSSNTVTVTARCRTSGFSLLWNRYGHGDRQRTVRLDRSDLRQLQGDDYCLTGNAMAGYSQAFFGDGASVELFISDTLVFRFPAVMHKKVPVELVEKLSFRPQYKGTGPIRFEPDSVTVYGEEQHLEGIVRVYTNTLRLNDVHGSVHGILKIGRLKGIRLSDEEVRYNLNVVRYVEVKAASVPIQVRGAPAGRRKIMVMPSTADVYLDCSFPLSQDVAGSVSLYVDYSDFAESKTGRCIPKPGPLPEGVIDYRIEPAVFDCIEADR